MHGSKYLLVHLPTFSSVDLVGNSVSASQRTLSTVTVAWKQVIKNKQTNKQTKKQGHSVVTGSLWPRGLYSLWNSPGQDTGVGSLSLLQGIFVTQGSNSGIPHCRQIPYQLSPKGSPRILEWVVYPFSSGSSQPRNQTRVSCIAGRFNWAIRDAQQGINNCLIHEVVSFLKYNW